ncbi:hypothetical protein CONCODRAFT_79987 [Conidiobolus coronatus NRRL 28638]|uniref:Uncharacterized protein n=1 Tax=Conidiobolus coronatus (strain ATCC 28846 / CBS 209.66 / NRRL 28638) TaxID=796925 RepID=A0A137NYT2_CONC2|nr:hypothetical protein CONCODRAFT_79987 [Conidiobolus coronatus NRRL 28638]|eukprot:KXN67814.1 hypothetical protein CONCODRAFT_79987 [Conidiobolus coronatus NRRL 28638]
MRTFVNIFQNVKRLLSYDSINLHFSLKSGQLLKNQFIPIKPIVKGSNSVNLLSRPSYIQAPILNYEPRYFNDSQNINRNNRNSFIASRYYLSSEKHHPFWGNLAQHVNNILATPAQASKPSKKFTNLSGSGLARYQQFVKSYTRYNGLSSVVPMYRSQTNSDSLPSIKHSFQKTSQLDLTKTINITYQFIKTVFQRNLQGNGFQKATIILTQSYKLQALRLMGSPYPNLRQLGQLLVSILPSIQRLTWKLTVDPQGLKVWFPIPFTADSIKSFLASIGFQFKSSKSAIIQSVGPTSGEGGILQYDRLLMDKQNFEFLTLLEGFKLRGN